MDIKDITKPAVCIAHDTDFKTALSRMLTEHTNTLLVVDDNGELAGEVSVSDLFDGIIPHSFDGDAALAYLTDETAFAEAVKAAADNLVSDFMSTDFETITPDATLMEVASVAIAQGRARMAVTDHEGRPIGMISRQGLKQILGKFSV